MLLPRETPVLAMVRLENVVAPLTAWIHPFIGTRAGDARVVLERGEKPVLRGPLDVAPAVDPESAIQLQGPPVEHGACGLKRSAHREGEDVHVDFASGFDGYVGRAVH